MLQWWINNKNNKLDGILDSTNTESILAIDRVYCKVHVVGV